MKRGFTPLRDFKERLGRIFGIPQTKPTLLVSKSSSSLTGFTPLRDNPIEKDLILGLFFAKRRISNPKKHQSLTGFTLVEAVVAVGVFTMLMTAIMGSFLAIIRADQKSRAIRLVSENARFISEFITREVRNGVIDYSGYGGTVGSVNPPGLTNTLRIVNAAGEFERIFLQSNAIRLDKTGIGSTDLSSAGMVVSNLNFYIYPRTNPFGGGSTLRQPRVTFTFTLTANPNSRPNDRAIINIQSTVSTREYPQI